MALNLLVESVVDAVKQELFTDECESIETCLSINRIITYLNEYQNNAIQFCKASHPFLSDDFHHILIKHLTENNLTTTRNKTFESIYDYIITKVQQCNLQKCDVYIRNNRNRETEDILSSLLNTDKVNDSLKYKLETMDTMHCFLMHSFESGFRIRSNQFSADNKDNDDTNDGELIKLYSYLRSKRERVQNIRGSDRASNSKFVTNITTKESDHKNTETNAYSFGNEYSYWKDSWSDKEQENYVKAKYRNLKHEVLQNKIFNINNSALDAITEKAKNKLSSHHGKSIRITQWTYGHQTLKEGDQMTLEYILAILLYTDLDKLSFNLSSTFRSLPNGSTFEDDIKRNAEYGNWSRLLIDSVRWFGTVVRESHINVYYHGINCKLIFDSLCGRFIGPTSTTAQLSVAMIFAKDTGIILQLQNADTHGEFTYFNCTWLSCFASEDERLFAGPRRPWERLVICGLRDMQAQMNYQVYLHALLSLTDITIGIIPLTNDYKEWEQNTFDAAILKELFRDFDARNEYKNKFTKYINDMFASFVNSLEGIYIYVDTQIDIQYPSIKPLFFDKDPMMIKIVDICNVFKNLKKIRLTYGTYHKEDIYFDDRYFDSFYSKIKTLSQSKIILEEMDISYIQCFNAEIFDTYKMKFAEIGYRMFCKYRKDEGQHYAADILIQFVGESAKVSPTPTTYEQFNGQKRYKLELLIVRLMRNAQLKGNMRTMFTFDIIYIMISYYSFGQREEGESGRYTFPHGGSDDWPFDIFWIHRNADGPLPNKDSMVDIEYTGYCCNDENGANLLFTGNEKEFVKRREILKLNGNKVIPGMSEVIVRINEGSTVKIWVNSKAAFGNKKHKGFDILIPPNCDLLFEVTLHKIVEETKAESKSIWNKVQNVVGKVFEKNKKGDEDEDKEDEDIESEEEPTVNRNWTNELQDIIQNKSTTLNLRGLSQKDAENFPWHLLKSCTSITELDISGYPSLNEGYRPYYDVLEWDIKSPQRHVEEIVNLFPSEVFELLNLEVLNLSGYPYSFLSEKLGNLTKLKTLLITGSPILYLPESIGKLKDLSKLDFYCSRRLRYVPYEILNCALKDTKMSTSRLYANYKNHLLVPPLPQTDDTFMDTFSALFIEYGLKGDVIDMIITYLPFTICSNIDCDTKIYFRECIHYGWSRQNPGTDVVCLLAKMCSNKCINAIRNGTRYYLGKIKSNHNDNIYYQNLKIVDLEPSKLYINIKPTRNIDEEMNRFRYFWRYNLGINFNSYKLVDDKKQIMVIFDGDAHL